MQSFIQEFYLAPLSEAPIYQIYIELLETEQPIWRKIQVRSDLGLYDFNLVIKAVMGWTNSHLHLFLKGAKMYTIRYAEDTFFGEGGQTDYKDLTVSCLLKTVGSEIIYVYDMGDYWKHSIKLEGKFRNQNI